MTQKLNSEIELDIIDNVLTKVIDPEIEIDLVNLGLIYDVTFDGVNNIKVTMTLSTPSCPLGSSIIQDVKESILRAYPTYHVDVDLVFEPQWNQTMITPKGREILGMK